MSQPQPSLADFVERLPYSNPFEDNRVTQADSLPSDVPEIHKDKFEELTVHAKKAASLKDKGRGVVVTGPPGIGKSHLLARFGEWAREHKFPFIYLLNLQSGPHDILSTILKTSISILTKGLAKTPGETRLYRMISITIKEALSQQNIIGPIDLKKARDAYVAMLSDLQHDGSIYEALWSYFEDVNNQLAGKRPDGRAELAKRWLSAGFLDGDEARQLKLNIASKSEDGYSLDLGQMKEVLMVLGQFARFRDRSFILCFDQVDTFSEEQVQSWSATTHMLLDSCPGLLVVTTGVDATFAAWSQKNFVAESSWHRIQQYTISLSGISAEIAGQMVQDRLDKSLAPFDAIAEVHQKRISDPSFPLGSPWVKQTLHHDDGQKKVGLRPRDVINKACSSWNQQSTLLCKLGVTNWLANWPDHVVPPPPIDIEKLIDEKVNAKLVEYYDTRMLRRDELPVDAGNVVGLLKSMLAACHRASPKYRSNSYAKLTGFDVAPPKGRTKPAFQMVVEQLSDAPDGKIRKIGVAVVETPSGIGATNMLKRIIAQLDGPNPPEKAIVIVDGRDPMKLTATAQKNLENLRSRTGRFAVETLDFEQYAKLDSYEGVIGLARAGDLEAVLPDGVGHPISEDEVYESHHRNGRYLTPPVLCQLIGKCNLPPDGLCEEPIDAQEILEATYARLALNPGTTTRELTNWWIEHRQPKTHESCRIIVDSLFKATVLKLHEEGKVYATPVNDYYIVLPKHELRTV